MDTASITLRWTSLAQMDEIAATCSVLWQPPAVVLLEGDLGAGKTTLVQAVLKKWGIQDRIKSPTFDLVHIYQMMHTTIYHVDLYRIAEASELMVLDLPSPVTLEVLLVEWGHWLRDGYPERFECQLTRQVDDARHMVITAFGQEPLKRLKGVGR
ncbi:MAG: tRNA (adenosine(37)-N6)-threonylcarbamoyltransferase complex ATPase subunit type 1 TsaE [Sulfobacillus sp.]